MTFFHAFKRFWQLFPDSGLDLADIGLMSAFLHLWNEAGRPDAMPIPTRHFTESLGIPEASFFRRRDQLVKGGFLEVTAGRKGQSPVYRLALNMRAKTSQDSSQNESQNSSQNESQANYSSQDSSQHCSQNESPIYKEEKEYKDTPVVPLAVSSVNHDAPVSLQTALANCAQFGVPPQAAEHWWNSRAGAGWVNAKGQPVVQWHYDLKSWWQSFQNRNPDQAQKLLSVRPGSQDHRDRKSNTARQPPQDVLQAAWLAYGGDLPVPDWPSIRANAAQLNALANAHPPLRKLLAATP